jgi:hypothetical protein
MQAISVPSGSTPTLIVAAGNRDFLHIYNNGSATVYVCYDSDLTTATSTLATTNGIPIPAGGERQLNNDGMKQIFTKPVYAVHGSGSAQELRVQGA